MEITVENRKVVFISDKKIANFSLVKIAENTYHMDNGRHIREIVLENDSLAHFKKKSIEKGFFIFEGNTKQLEAFRNRADQLANKANEVTASPDRVLGYDSNTNSFNFMDKTITVASLKANKRKITIVFGDFASGKSRLIEKLQVADKSNSRNYYQYSKNVISVIEQRQLLEIMSHGEPLFDNMVIECPVDKLCELSNQLNKSAIEFKNLFIESKTDDLLYYGAPGFEAFEVTVIHTKYQP